jgi:hypothetical protein
LDDNWFNRIFSAAAGVWALVAMAAVALFRAWPQILGRFNERYRDRQAEAAADWDRIRSERDVAREERDLVRDRWAQCEAERLQWMARAIAAEAALVGRGQAAQEVTILESRKRLKDEK